MSEFLPVEVISEVLKWLPVKSLVKCMSICKTWNILIKSPSFISSHLQASLSNPHLHLLMFPPRAFSLHFDNDEIDEFKQLHYPVALNQCLTDYIGVLGSCTGLVCLCGGDHYIEEIVLWNPSILKYFIVPKPAITQNPNLIFGFGFDSKANDYKLLKVVFGQGETPTQAYLFSLNENSWKTVTASFPERQNLSTLVEGAARSLAYVNGAFHWMGYKEQGGGFRCMILGFDLSTEQFFALRLPESLIFSSSMKLSIKKYNESTIAVLKTDRENVYHQELWVMKEYGAVGSWSKMLHLTDQSGFGSRPEVIGFRKNGEVLLRVDREKIVSVDLNCQQMEPREINLQVEHFSVHQYVEGLALLDKGLDAGSVTYAINHANDSSSELDSHSEEEDEMA
ncbi:hypothetical protein PTKIN_Ptkin14bG0106300 [Pterospermum kingtungense]